MRRLAILALSSLAILALAACSSTEQTLDPSAITPPQGTASTPPAGTVPNAPAGTPQPQTATTPSPAAGQVAAIPSSTRVQFAPIVGATVEAVTPLTERLAVRARERGIRLAGSGDASTTHVLKGYFSAMSEGRETTVIYVWDVLDPAGNRLHRIQGQQKTPATNSEGWASVSAPAMQAIADQTIDQLASWLSTSAG